MSDTDELLICVACKVVADPTRGHCEICLGDAGLRRFVPAGALDTMRADSERVDWLETAVPSGEFRDRCAALPKMWPGSVRALIDAARATPPGEAADGK